MAARSMTRLVSRRFSSNGRVLSEEEKAAENVYIKKVEQEKLERLARKGAKPEEKATSSAPADAGAPADAKPPASASATGATSEKVSTDKYRNYAVLAGTITALGALGWYLKSGEKKAEVQD